MAQFANANFKLREPAKPADYMNFTQKPPEKKLTEEELQSAMAGIFGA